MYYKISIFIAGAFLLSCNTADNTKEQPSGDSVLTTSPATDLQADPGQVMAYDTASLRDSSDTPGELRKARRDSVPGKK